MCKHFPGKALLISCCGALLLFCLHIQSVAQNLQVISGIVTDSATGKPLPGVTVVEVGTNHGTVTDAQGQYRLSISGSAARLRFSYIGYRSKIVPIENGLTHLNIGLTSSNTSLNELVVIGYGSQKKADVTGAVAQLNANRIEERPISRLEQAMQGQLAGVQVRATTGQPGAALQIRIRGTASISAGNDPLYVVDGIPVSDLGDLNPEDIASIEVLKDAASSAIYGSRGANGVVLITTKKGLAGRTRFTLNAYTGIQQLAKKMDLLSPQEWIDLARQIEDSNWVKLGIQRGKNYQASDPIWFRQQELGVQQNATYIPDSRWAYGTDSLAFIDWQDAFYRKAPMSDVQLTASGGTTNFTYRLSGNYLDQEGIAVYTDYKLASVRANFEGQMARFLKVGLEIAPSYSWLNGGEVDGKDNQSHHVLAMVPVAEKDAGINTGVAPYSRYYWAGSTQSPVAYERATTDQQNRLRLLSNMYVLANLYKGLDLKITGAWNADMQFHKVYHPTLGVGQTPGSASSGSYSTANAQYYLFESLLTYNHSFGGHNINLLAGYTAEETIGTNSGQSHRLFANDELTTLNNATSTVTSSTTSEYKETLLSYLGRILYNYKDKYLASVAFRRDGSSKFGANNKWGNFPSFSLGWNVAQENFMHAIPWINVLKLRYSWGMNGNNSIPNYLAYGGISAANYSFNGALVNGYVPSSLSNPDLHWEKTRSSNYGADISVINNRISLSIDHYDKLTTDLLLNVPVALATGFSSGWVNIGHVQNKGWEFELNTRNLTGQLQWQTSFNIGFNHNKVLALGQGNAPIHTGFSNLTQIIEVGQPLNAFYLYDAIGVYTNDADLKASPHMSTNIVGDVKYKDVNGDGIIDANDRTIMGYPDPTYSWGIYNTFSYKGVDLSFLIQGSGGNKVYELIGRAIDRPSMGFTQNALGRWRNRWRSPSQPGDGHTPRIDGTTGGFYDSRWLYDATYARFKNLTIGYTFPHQFIKGVDNARIYFSAENIFYIINRDYGGYSPEALNTSGGDYGSYPDAKTFMLGINLSF